MVLLGLVLRALGVALLTATVLLPVADHHAAARLPEAVAHPLSVHDLLAHHHHMHVQGSAHAAAAAWAGVAAVPSVLPNVSSWAEGAGVPFAALEGSGVVGWLAPVAWLSTGAAARPAALERGPPQPPPLLPA